MKCYLKWKNYWDAQQIICRLDALRNEVAFISQRVEDDLSEWRKELFNGVELRLGGIEDKANQLTQSASNFRVRRASAQWAELWSYFTGCVENKKGLVSEIEGYDPVPPNDDPELILLYGEYLNFEYLQIDY